MLNKSIIMGRITADIDLRQTPSNVSVCRFTVACERNFAPQGQERQTDFISVIAWRNTADFISKYFKKGSMIVVEGSLQTGSYADKKYPDVKHYTTDIVAEQVYFGESKKADNTTTATAQTTAAPTTEDVTVNAAEFEEIIGNGDLPF